MTCRMRIARWISKATNGHSEYNNNNNNNNVYLLQLACYPVAVVILHV